MVKYRGGGKISPRPLKPLIEIYDEFYVSTNNNIIDRWLPVWKMVVSEKNPYKKDLFKFSKEIK